MISKKRFVEAIGLIKEHRDKEDDLCNVLRSIDADCGGVFLYSKYEDMLVKILQEDCDLNDRDDLIGKFIYDTDFGKSEFIIRDTVKDKCVLIDSPEVLYDFLTGDSGIFEDDAED